MGIAVQKMFDGIASRYDFLNHFLSMGRDRAWRKKAIDCLERGKNPRILDLCGGTGDFWKTWSDRQQTGNSGKPPGMEKDAIVGPRSVIADFSLPMLMGAKEKFTIASDPGSRRPGPYLVRMDALHPCFKPGTFDVVICAYGMRNLDSVPAGIDAMHRLLKPAGVFLTLEFFRPTTLFTHLFYQVLAPLCIPFIGWIFSSQRQAYTYLVESIRKFRSVGEYRDCFEQRGFKNVSITPCDFGISHIVTAVKG